MTNIKVMTFNHPNIKPKFIMTTDFDVIDSYS